MRICDSGCNSGWNAGIEGLFVLKHSSSAFTYRYWPAPFLMTVAAHGCLDYHPSAWILRHRSGICAVEFTG